MVGTTLDRVALERGDSAPSKRHDCQTESDLLEQNVFRKHSFYSKREHRGYPLYTDSAASFWPQLLEVV